MSELLVWSVKSEDELCLIPDLMIYLRLMLLFRIKAGLYSSSWLHDARLNCFSAVLLYVHVAIYVSFPFFS